MLIPFLNDLRINRTLIYNGQNSHILGALQRDFKGPEYFNRRSALVLRFAERRHSAPSLMARRLSKP